MILKTHRVPSTGNSSRSCSSQLPVDTMARLNEIELRLPDYNRLSERD